MQRLAALSSAMVPSIPAATLQNILQVLFVVSVLLTLRALLSRTWVTMWFAALVSLAATLVGLWSFGLLIFLLTCVQLATAVAMRRASGTLEWVALLFAGVATFGLVVYGLAFLRLWDYWMVGFLLTFLGWSVPLRPRHLPGHQHPLTASTS